MTSAKDIHVRPISAADATRLVKLIHYSGKVAAGSMLHLGVFLNERLEGVMSFGSSIDKRKMLPIVRETGWNGFLELNRMAFSDRLPRNSESRALGVAIRLIKKNYPHVEWIVSFADGTQCGDGTIYRASGFALTAIRKNKTLLRMPDGSITSDLSLNLGKTGTAGEWKRKGATPLPGYQLRYIYFMSEAVRARCTCDIIPFSEIDRLGAGMYKGKQCARSKENVALGVQSREGGEIPTQALHP